MMKKLVSFFLCVCIIAAGIGVLLGVKLLQSEKSISEEATSYTPPPVNVQVRKLEPTTLDDVLLLTGYIEAWEEVLISAEVAGVIEWQGVEEGQKISRGDELVRIDTTWYQATYDQAAARHELMQQELARMKSLRKSGVSSPQQLDQSTTEEKTAKADVASARLQLDKAIVRASMDGVIDTLQHEENEWADRGAPLLKLVQVDRVKALVGIPERDIVFFQVGDEVQISLDALPEQQFTGKIHRIATSADRVTRTFLTEIALDNADKLLKPGMTVRTRLIRKQYENAISIPIFAVISLENQRFAVVADNGVARIRPIEVGILQGDQVQVTKGLQPGDQLIIVGQRDLRDGQAIQVVDGQTQ